MPLSNKKTVQYGEMNDIRSTKLVSVMSRCHCRRSYNSVRMTGRLPESESNRLTGNNEKYLIRKNPFMLLIELNNSILQ